MAAFDPTLYGGGPSHPITVPSALGNARMFLGLNLLDQFALAVATGMCAAKDVRADLKDEGAAHDFALDVFELAQALLDEREYRAARALERRSLEP